MNNEQLKIKQAVLKAVRKISGAAFNKKLGDNFSISFTCSESYLDFILWFDGEIIKCFNGLFIDKSGSCLVSAPISIKDIPEFEAKVEKGLADIFEYVSKHE